MGTALSPFDHLRISDFNQRLQDEDKEIRAFKRKEVMNMEEMKTNVENLTHITAKLEAAVTELEVRDVSDTTNTNTLKPQQNTGRSSWKNAVVSYRISTMSRLYSRRSRASSRCSKL